SWIVDLRLRMFVATRAARGRGPLKPATARAYTNRRRSLAPPGGRWQNRRTIDCAAGRADRFAARTEARSVRHTRDRRPRRRRMASRNPARPNVLFIVSD